MKESSIKACTNPRNIFNSTNQEACLIANRLGGWGLKNLLHWFAPVEIVNVVLLPVNGNVPEDEMFLVTDFDENGALFDVPMNHYLTVKTLNSKKSFLVNAGYIGRHFFVSDRAAFRELKRLIAHAIETKLDQSQEECEECSTNSSNS